MQPSTQKPRRQFLKAAAGSGLAVLGSAALAQRANRRLEAGGQLVEQRMDRRLCGDGRCELGGFKLPHAFVQAQAGLDQAPRGIWQLRDDAGIAIGRRAKAVMVSRCGFAWQFARADCALQQQPGDDVHQPRRHPQRFT